MNDRAGLITDEGEWLQVHRGPDEGPAWFYVTDCGTCRDLAHALDSRAIDSAIYIQRGRILLAFAYAHHNPILDTLRMWYFFRSLKAHGWPADLLRDVAEAILDFEFTGGATQELTVREHRQMIIWETYAQRHERGQTASQRRDRIGSTS